MKKETREFFGLDEACEEGQRLRWQEKRKRLASRKYGQLKDHSNTTHHTLSFTSDFHALPEVREAGKKRSRKKGVGRGRWEMGGKEMKLVDGREKK